MATIDLFTDAPPGIGQFTLIAPASGNPGVGNFSYWAATTELEISDTAKNGVDVGSLFDELVTGNHIILYSKGESRTYSINTVDDNSSGGWHSIDVTEVSSSTSFALTQDDVYAIQLQGGGGGAGTGDVTAAATLAEDYLVIGDAAAKGVKTGTPTAAHVVANTAKTSNANHDGDVTGSTTLTIANSAVTLAKMADMATASFIGRDTAATGAPEILSGAEATALLSEFAKDNTTQGVVPASDNSTSKFLRADGAWIAPGVGGGGSGDKTLASNVVADLDATEIVVGGAYIDGSTGGTYSWEMLGTYNDNGGTGNQDIELRLYDRGPDGTPVAGVLRSVLEITSLDTLDRVTQTLTASASPGVDTDTIYNTARMYEVRAYIDAAGAVDTARILSCVFIET